MRPSGGAGAPGGCCSPRGPSSPVPCSSLRSKHRAPHLSRGFWARLCTRAQAWLFRGWSSTGTLRGRRTGFWSSSSLRPATEGALASSVRAQTDLDDEVKLLVRPLRCPERRRGKQPWGKLEGVGRGAALHLPQPPHTRCARPLAQPWETRPDTYNVPSQDSWGFRAGLDA